MRKKISSRKTMSVIDVEPMLAETCVVLLNAI
jgi:hypothetical protein